MKTIISFFVASIFLNIYFICTTPLRIDGDILERALKEVVDAPQVPSRTLQGYYLLDQGVAQTIWIFDPNGGAREVVYNREVRWSITPSDEIMIASIHSDDFSRFGSFKGSQITTKVGQFSNEYKKINVRW